MVLHLQRKLNAAQELVHTAEVLLEQSLPARLKDFEQRLNLVTDKHAATKARYEQQEKVLKEEVANKIGVSALRRIPIVFALSRPQPEQFRNRFSPLFPCL